MSDRLLRRFLEEGHTEAFIDVIRRDEASDEATRRRLKAALLEAPPGKRWNILMQAVYNLNADAVRAIMDATDGEAHKETSAGLGVLDALDQRRREEQTSKGIRRGPVLQDYDVDGPLGSVVWELLRGTLKYNRWTSVKGRGLVDRLVAALEDTDSLRQCLTYIRGGSRWSLTQQIVAGALHSGNAQLFSDMVARAPAAFADTLRGLNEAVDQTLQEPGVRPRPEVLARIENVMRTLRQSVPSRAPRPEATRRLARRSVSPGRSRSREEREERGAGRSQGRASAGAARPSSPPRDGRGQDRVGDVGPGGFPFGGALDGSYPATWMLKEKRGTFFVDPASGDVEIRHSGSMLCVGTLRVVEIVRGNKRLAPLRLLMEASRRAHTEPTARPSALLPFPSGAVPGFVNSEIMALMRKPESAGALFVLPSQLNGCEYPSHEIVVRSVDEYLTDRTGGPRGQLAAHPAVAQALLNSAASDANPNGFHVLRDNLPSGEWAVRNGYLKFPRFGRQLEAVLESWASHVLKARLALAEDVLVCGLDARPNPEWPTCIDDVRQHAVGLAYASAAPVCTYINEAASRQEPTEREGQAIASCMLIAAQYLASLQHASRTAAPDRPRIVYLMPLGAGVFENAKIQVALALRWALGQLSRSERACVTPILVCWGRNSELLDFRGLLQA